jgi:hypothetical protein
MLQAKSLHRLHVCFGYNQEVSASARVTGTKDGHLMRRGKRHGKGRVHVANDTTHTNGGQRQTTTSATCSHGPSPIKVTFTMHHTGTWSSSHSTRVPPGSVLDVIRQNMQETTLPSGAYDPSELSEAADQNWQSADPKPTMSSRGGGASWQRQPHWRLNHPLASGTPTAHQCVTVVTYSPMHSAGVLGRHSAALPSPWVCASVDPSPLFFSLFFFFSPSQTAPRGRLWWSQRQRCRWEAGCCTPCDQRW